MFRNDVIQPVNQFWFPERDVRGALLKVSDAEHLIFIALLTLNGLNVVIQTDDDIFPVVGDGPAAEQVQHPFQVSNPVSLLSGDKMKSPSVPPHQIVDDNFTVKFAGAIGFVIPAQSPEDVDDSPLKHLILILVQLFKCAQNVRFTDFRKIIIFQ
ncbi:hypothetical protein BvCmsNSNP012_02638 [Escherichia coli]|nr:hypothetical protein BvCmsNSNP012_02638 [Escherichia coli]